MPLNNGMKQTLAFELQITSQFVLKAYCKETAVWRKFAGLTCRIWVIRNFMANIVNENHRSIDIMRYFKLESDYMKQSLLVES